MDSRVREYFAQYPMILLFFIYGYGLGYESNSLNIVLGLLVCLITVFHLFRFDELKTNLPQLIYLMLGVHIAFYLGTFITGNDNKILWGVDANIYHIPSSVDFISLLKNSYNNNEYFNGRVLPIHITTGVLFQLIGVNTLATTLSTLMFKVPTLILIKKLGVLLFGQRVGKVSGFLFILFPSVFMYSAMFFKEVSIQLYVVSFFYFFIRYTRDDKKSSLLLVLLSILLIGYERVYLIPGIMLGIVFWILYKVYTKDFVKQNLGLLISLLSIGLLLLYYYIPILGIDNAFSYIQSQREVYLGLDGVTKWNKLIPFPLTFFKILLAPFFTLNKFETYHDLSFLILWSAPFVNLFMGLMFFEMLKKSKENPTIHLPVTISVFIYLLLLAYVRPFDARVRDSFAPIFIIYFSSYFCTSSRVESIRAWLNLRRG